MSSYFLIGFVVSALLCIMLFVWLCISLDINWSRRNKIGFSYLLPVVLTVLFVGAVIFEFRPRFQDTFHILSDNILSLTLEPETYTIRGRRLYHQEKVYILPPDPYERDSDLSYRLTIAPTTHIVLSIEPVEEFEDAGLPDIELTKP